ncbi:MAG: PAS domain-containing protein [bacterium]
MKEFSGLNFLNYCATAVFVINKDHTVIYWNRACERLTGCDAETMIGSNSYWQAFYDHVRPCLCDLIVDKKFNMIKKYYDTCSRSVLLYDGWHGEGWFKNMGGMKRFISFDAAPIYNKKGDLIAAIETLHDISKRKRAEEKNEKLTKKLQDALAKVKHLHGLIPICAGCKKIRDDKGYWNQIEIYIQNHSEAEFSHSLCPECAKKLYPKTFGKEEAE